ncbi:MAG: hypothetical protein V4685_11100 [Bacteroidota bacterium]
MKAILQHPAANNNFYSETYAAAKTSMLHRFAAWLNTQEEKRFFWAAISLVGHGTFFTIVTFATVILTGNVFALLAITCATMMMVLAVNLAALPVKYIIPVFFASLIVDALVMITAIALWL